MHFKDSTLKQFIIYRLIPKDGDVEKIPCSPHTGLPISVKDTDAWITYPEAEVACVKWQANGIAFVVAPPYWFLDIDHCLDHHGQWSALAVELCTQFSGAFVEISQSGRGLHLFGRGDCPMHRCKSRVADGLELYTQHRFAALTGTGARGDIQFDATSLLPALVQKYFAPEEESFIPVAGVHPAWAGPVDDEELISLMLSSKSSPFRRGAAIQDLWAANADALGRAYPARSNEQIYDYSSADAALAQHLAFWTGNDAERMIRLMYRSQLVRDKWQQRTDYLPRTIDQARAKQTTFYHQTTVGSVQPRAGNTLLGIDEQIALFGGCVYVMDEHKALIPGGYLVNSERFRVIYGGHSFVMDLENGRVCRNAWEAFTENQGFKCDRVVSSCFRPLLPAGAIVTENGAKLVNTWWPIDIPRRMGDATPFLSHVKKLYPDDEERERIICYLAALVQYQGIKFEWCPIIQGVQGNGKTLLARCLAHAIGNRYTHYPKADQITSKFNDWMDNRILIVVEDIYESNEKTIESLKVIINGDRQEIEPKGGRKVTKDVCCNYIINTNHRDALRKTRDDRRFGIFYTAQQEKADLARDGMTGNYFPALYGWLRNGGYEVVSELLHTYIIQDEYNPALGHIAPTTRFTETAILESSSILEQEIKEAIEQGMNGFRGGWISSMALDLLLKQLSASTRLTRRKRQELLKALGYIPHPRLPDGRVNNPVLPDGGKPRLFIHHLSPNVRLLKTAAEVARAYSDAQQLT